MIKSPAWIAASFVAASLTGASAAGDSFAPSRASSIDLGATRGSAYYVAEPDGYHLVATLYADGAATPIRFNTVLADGQSASVSVPGPVGTVPQEVTFSRSANGLTVRPAVQTSAVTQ